MPRDRLVLLDLRTNLAVNAAPRRPRAPTVLSEVALRESAKRFAPDGVNFIYALTATLSSGAGAPNLDSGGSAAS